MGIGPSDNEPIILIETCNKHINTVIKLFHIQNEILSLYNNGNIPDMEIIDQYCKILQFSRHQLFEELSILTDVISKHGNCSIFMVPLKTAINKVSKSKIKTVGDAITAGYATDANGIITILAAYDREYKKLKDRDPINIDDINELMKILNMECDHTIAIDSLL